MIAARAGIGDRHIDVAWQRTLQTQVELHDVGRLQIEIDRLQLRADRRVRIEALRDDRKGGLLIEVRVVNGGLRLPEKK